MNITAIDAIQLRPERETDQPFLEALYASTRHSEMAALPWSPPQKQEFLRSQFRLQHAHYKQHFARAEFCIIECDNTAIGRLYYGWEGKTLRLIDISLLPPHKHQGIGGRLMRRLMADIKQPDERLFLHVDIFNPARDWYLRLGFTPVDPAAAPINGIYQQLQWCMPAG